MKTIRLDDGNNIFPPTPDEDFSQPLRVLALGGNDKVFTTRFGDIIDGGAGNDQLSGGAGDDEVLAGNGRDHISGDEGNDTLVADGRAQDGVDFLSGGEGNDVYEITQGLSFTLFSQTDSRDPGQDLLKIGVTVDIGIFVGLEDVTLLFDDNTNITGNLRDNVLTGNPGSNAIAGAGGRDRLAGGDGDDTLNGQSGNDVMIGGAGDDVYFVDQDLDHTIERLRQGNDTISSSVDLSLAPRSNIETLILTGPLGIRGTGNDAANVIIGSDFRNIIEGGGGLDLLKGGNGDDSYVLSDLSLFRLAGRIAGEMRDRIVDSGGDDTAYVNSVKSILSMGESKSYKLDSDIENGVVTGTKAFNLQGNDLANTLTGNAAANIISGGLDADSINGGRGADILKGGAGSDSYFLYDLADRNPADGVNLPDFDVVEELQTNGGANDTVHVKRLTSPFGDATSYILGANVENGVIDGNGDFNMGGNELGNTLEGNNAANSLGGGIAGDDVLSGNGGSDFLDGGSGRDVMSGGAGDDSMFIDNVADRVVEQAGEGNDTVLANVSVTLSNNVENLGLTGSLNLVGTGNALGNLITGQLGANLLRGLDGFDTLSGFDGADTITGGTGLDTLSGGTGADHFRFDAEPFGTNADVITDYSSADDTIELENAQFTALGPAGVLPTSAFRISEIARDADDRIVYNSTTGHLIYDSNGNASGGVVLIATLTRGLSLTNADILVV
ncbi:hypothetical protein BH10PSE7_BH10PSE7_17010 [soil metagenome]